MNVWIDRCQKVLIFRSESGPVPKNLMTLNSMRVELGRKQIALILLTEDAAFIANQTGRSHPPHSRHHRHQLPGTLKLLDDRGVFGIDATLDEVKESIAQSSFRVLEIGAGGDRLSRRRKNNLDWIVMAFGGDPLKARSVGSNTPDAGSIPLYNPPFGDLDPKRPTIAVRQIEPPVW